MAQVALAGLIEWPPYQADDISVTATQTLIDASGEKVAAVFPVPRTGTLDGCGVLLGNVTQAPASGVTFSFQDVNSSGEPDGTPDQYRVVTAGLTSAAWLESGVMDDAGTGSGNKRSVTRGDLLSVVMEFTSFAASDSIRWAIQSTLGSLVSLPYTALYTSSAWAKQNIAPFLVLKYSDGTYENIYFGRAPAQTSFTNVTFSTSTTPDEVALIFTPTVPISVAGAWARVDLDGATDFVLYDTDGSTSLASRSFTSGPRGNANQNIVYGLFATDVLLAAGSTYRMAVKPTSTTSITLRHYTVESSAILSGQHGGSAMHYSSRTDAGSWSEVTTRRPFIGLLINKFSDGTGGGSGGPVTLVGGGLVQ